MKHGKPFQRFSADRRFQTSLEKENLTMSTDSYSRLRTHLIWETLSREKMLDTRAAVRTSQFLIVASQGACGENYGVLVQFEYAEGVG